jgi:predicted nuclease of predicted toxin-antitoxin system
MCRRRTAPRASVLSFPELRQKNPFNIYYRTSEGEMTWKRLPVTEEAEGTWRAAKQTKFFVDESLGPETTAYLREKGLNVKDVFEERLKGRSDEDVLAFAWRSRRVLLTHDRDFLDDQRFPEHRNPGIIILPGGEGDQASMGYGIHRVLSVFSKDPDAWRHQKMIVTIDTIEIRGPGNLVQRYRIDKNGRVFQWREE